MNKTKSILLTAVLAVSTLTSLPKARAFVSDDLKWNGDMRLRSIHLRESTDDSRYYEQLRARLGLRAKVQDDLDAVLQLSTAASAISGNQTLGDSSSPGMARRTFGIDLAYADWKAIDNGRLIVGRTANPFFAPGKTQLVFDVDLAFEGVSFTYNPKWSQSSAFATVSANIISENYSAPRDIADTALVALELGYGFQLGGQWTLHAARFNYSNVADQLISRFESGAGIDRYSSPFERYRGNSVYATNPSAPVASRTYNMASNFTQTEAGFEWKMKQDPLELTGYVDWIANELAGVSGEAWEAGFNTRYGRFSALIAYAMKKSDSMIGAFTDSDTNGGGTDNRGTKVSLAYQLSDRTNVVLTDYRGTRGMDSTPRDFNAQLLDFSMQF